MVATGLSESPQAYRAKLLEQSDSQIDAWAIGSLRDMAKRKGIVATIHEFSHSAHLDEDGLAVLDELEAGLGLGLLGAGEGDETGVLADGDHADLAGVLRGLDDGFLRSDRLGGFAGREVLFPGETRVNEGLS